MSIPAIALVKRELMVTLRKKRAFGLLVAVTGGVLVTVLHNWPDESMILLYPTQVSLNTLNLLGKAALFGAALFLPGLSGSAIALERDRDCFDLLHMTMLGPAGIAAGKLANAMGFFTLIVVGMLPVFGVTFFQVGVSWPELLVRVATIYAFALACSCIGLLFSAWCRRTPVAVTLSYMGMLCLTGLPAGMAADIVFSVFPNVARNVGPQVDVFRATMPVVLFQGRLTPVAGGWISVMFLSLLAGFAFFLTLRVMGRTPKPRVIKEEDIIDDSAQLQARRSQFPYYLIDPCRRRPMIEDGRNPMMAREFRWGFLGRMSRLVRTFYGTLGACILLALGCAQIWAVESLGQTIFIYHSVQASLLCLLAPAMLSNTFTKERELGNFDMLRMTLMPREQVFLGKFGAACITLSPMLAAMLAASLLLGMGSFAVMPGVTPIATSALGLLCLALCMGYVLMLSLTASLHARTGTGAVMLAYVLCLLVLLGIVFGAEYLFRAGSVTSPYASYGRIGPQMPWTMFLSPLTALWQMLEFRSSQSAELAPKLFTMVVASAFLIRCLYDYMRFAFARYYRRDV